jgi:drug/metabolite transporter (DMT)-like permease
VGFGIVREGLPGPLVLVGIGLALVAVVLVSRVPAPEGSRSGVEFGLAAGLGIGLFNILVAGLPEGQVFGPLVIFKITATAVIGSIVVFGRQPWRVSRRSWPVALAVGVADMGGNGFYVLATQAGRLDIAATLSSLYPVTTVLLALMFLGERLSRGHAIGIVTAGAAIALITSGTRG